MPTDVIMPALGVAQQTGILLKWLKTEGQSVSKGEPLMEVETDKATVEIEAAASGTLAQVSARAGDEIPVGQRIAVILASGEVATPAAVQDPHPRPLPGGEGEGEGRSPTRRGVPEDRAAPSQVLPHLDVDAASVGLGLPARAGELDGVLNDLVEVAGGQRVGLAPPGHRQETAHQGPPVMPRLDDNLQALGDLGGSPLAFAGAGRAPRWRRAGC